MKKAVFILTFVWSTVFPQESTWRSSTDSGTISYFIFNEISSDLVFSSSDSDTVYRLYSLPGNDIIHAGDCLTVDSNNTLVRCEYSESMEEGGDLNER